MCCFLTIGVKFKFHCLHQFFFQYAWNWFTLQIIITQNVGTHLNELVINLEEYENIFRDSNSAIMIFAFLFNGNQLYKEKKYLLFCKSWFPCGRSFSPKEQIGVKKIVPLCENGRETLRCIHYALRAWYRHFFSDILCHYGRTGKMQLITWPDYH